MKLFLTSLGCDKTLSDSEHILGSLLSSGFELTDEAHLADIIAINTCCFIGDALSESIDTVIMLGSEKSENTSLIVFGCMAKRFQEEISSQLPEVDLIIPETEPEIITERILEYTDKTRKSLENKRFLTGPGYYAYLKIAEGCNKGCRYCIIPSVRGRYKSIPMENLLEEARTLAKNGVKELMLVAQETTLYGTDIYGEKSLHTLINRLSGIESIEWIRLLYAYPEEIYPGLIEEMAQNPKVCHYIDMPLQHCNDDILKSMGRLTDKASIVKQISALRKAMPDIAIRTTFITGYPGETEESHRELCEFIKETGFQRLGVFTYSREENTKAYDLPDQIPEETAEKRRVEIMEIQKSLSTKNGQSAVGKVFKCIVEGYIPEENIYQARSYMDCPDIDGLVFFPSNREIISGDFVEVLITGSLEYDLIGELYESS